MTNTSSDKYAEAIDVYLTVEGHHEAKFVTTAPFNTEVLMDWIDFFEFTGAEIEDKFCHGEATGKMVFEENNSKYWLITLDKD